MDRVTVQDGGLGGGYVTVDVNQCTCTILLLDVLDMKRTYDKHFQVTDIHTHKIVQLLS